MPRKPRLEYENAFYHVMNRGRRRGMIFHGEEFRGRFKSILVEKDAYIIQLSRYIHRNPIDMKNPLILLKKGPQLENEARKVAMYLCQQLTDKYLIDIAKKFNLKSTGSVSYTTHMIRNKKKDNKKFANKIDGLIKSIASQLT